MRSKVRSLDEYQRFIKQHEQAATPAAKAGDNAKNGAGKNGDVFPSVVAAKKKKAAAAAPPADAPNTRYVLRAGVTVAVVEETAETETAEAPPLAPAAPKPTRTPAPKVVTVLDIADVPEGKNERPRRSGDGSNDDASLPASLWERLPRHIQLLAQIPAPLEEEVAQKYYTRGFRESREELIERLLDPPLTLEDTARVLGVCPATVRRYTNRGVLLHQRTVGQQRRFRLSDVLLFLEKQQNKSAAMPARGSKKG